MGDTRLNHQRQHPHGATYDTLFHTGSLRSVLGLSSNPIYWSISPLRSAPTITRSAERLNGGLGSGSEPSGHGASHLRGQAEYVLDL